MRPTPARIALSILDAADSAARLKIIAFQILLVPTPVLVPVLDADPRTIAPEVRSDAVGGVVSVPA